MSGKTTQTQRLILAVVAFLMGLFLMLVAPFRTLDNLNPCLKALIEVWQVAEPDGVWDTPVPILTVTFHVWMALFVFAGAILVVIAKDIYKGKPWARPLALMLLALPAVGGLSFVIPWMVLVVRQPGGGKNPNAGTAPGMIIMVLGLIAYFLMLLLEKADWKTKLAQVVLFGWLGVTAGMVYMNAQHGVRYFLHNPSAPYFDPKYSHPELFLGGYVLYASTALFIFAIGLLAARHISGWYVGVIASVMTTIIMLLVFIDRQQAGAPGAVEWLRGALISLFLFVLLLIPAIWKRILGDVEVF
ncbi:MAG: hypothetical protein GXO36_04045 [Chloroflexi bacterium]|nr:hypothetical protein [Chloroflexota bacterium]